MQNLDQRRKALAAQLSSFSSSKQKKRIVSPYLKRKAPAGLLAKFGTKKVRVVSPYVNRAKTISERLSDLGTPKVTVVEKTVYLGKPGDKGDIGDRGPAPTRAELMALIRPLIPEVKDGNTPILGKDYLTQAEIESIKQEILAAVPGVLEMPKALTVDQDFVKQIVQIMHTLPENDKLEVSKGIRNAQSFIYKGTKYGMEEMMHGGSSSSGPTGTVYYTPTGTVNASNAIFGVTARPTSVISDGITYFEGAGYSYSSLQITMDIAPSQYIRYSL